MSKRSLLCRHGLPGQFTNMTGQFDLLIHEIWHIYSDWFSVYLSLLNVIRIKNQRRETKWEENNRIVASTQPNDDEQRFVLTITTWQLIIIIHRIQRNCNRSSTFSRNGSGSPVPQPRTGPNSEYTSATAAAGPGPGLGHGEIDTCFCGHFSQLL